MRKPPVLALGVLTVAAVTALVPTAANAADTNVTFTLSGGSLTLTAPAAAALTAGGLGVGGTTATGTLGSSVVTDTRGALAHTVTVTMSSTDFTTTGGATIDKSNVTGYSGVAVPGAVAVPVPTLTGQTVGASGGAAILQLTGVVGSASATYSPTVSVAVPGNAVAGDYSGVVTQTAA